MEYVEQNNAQCQGQGTYTMHGLWLLFLPLRIVLQETEDSAPGTRGRKSEATTNEKTAKDK
jgi:hypothetical protein